MNESTPQPEIIPAAPPPLSPSDERTWAMLAHLSILLNLVTGFLGVVAPLVIYLVYKDRSRYVAYQSMQAFLFQLIFWGGGTFLTAIAWVVSSLLSAVLIGLLLMPIACIISAVPIAAIIYAVVGGLQCFQGAEFRYWLVGDLTDNLGAG